MSAVSKTLFYDISDFVNYIVIESLLSMTLLTFVILCFTFLQNGVMTGVYPGSPAGFMVVVGSYMSYNKYNQLDPSLGLFAKVGQHIPIR